MTDWYKVNGSAITAEFDATSSKVYVYQRKNFQQVGDDNWTYDERKLSHDEYRIVKLESENTNLQLALTELYESILEG